MSDIETRRSMLRRIGGVVSAGAGIAFTGSVMAQNPGDVPSDLNTEFDHRNLDEVGSELRTLDQYDEDTYNRFMSELNGKQHRAVYRAMQPAELEISTEPVAQRATGKEDKVKKVYTSKSWSNLTRYEIHHLLEYSVEEGYYFTSSNGESWAENVYPAFSYAGTTSSWVTTPHADMHIKSHEINKFSWCAVPYASIGCFDEHRMETVMWGSALAYPDPAFELHHKKLGEGLTNG